MAASGVIVESKPSITFLRASVCMRTACAWFDFDRSQGVNELLLQMLLLVVVVVVLRKL